MCGAGERRNSIRPLGFLLRGGVDAHSASIARARQQRARGDMSLNQTALLNQYPASALEVSHSLAVNGQIASAYGAGELQTSPLFNDRKSRAHLAADALSRRGEECSRKSERR